MHPLPMNSQSGSSRSPFGAASYGVSKSFSPASQQAPEVVLTEAENDPDEEEELSSSPSGSEDNAGGADESRSAAERLAEKRRIKRFR